MDTYDRIEQLMLKRGEKASDLAKATGMSTGLLSQWKSRMQKPSAAKLSKVAAHYGVTTDYLLTGEEKENAPAPTEKDKRDAAKEVKRIMDDLENSGELMFDGVPLSDEARESLAAAMKLGLEAARLKNKETYTPKKYRK